MAKVVSFINMKGGVGKTTVAFNLAWYAAYYEDKRVLVIDLDPQANASQYLLGPAKYKQHIEKNRGTVVDILEQFTPAVGGVKAPSKPLASQIIATVRDWSDRGCIKLVPSRLELAWTLKNPTSKDHLIAKFIADVEKDFDLILIDCAPTESILTLAAYRASRYLIVPVKPEFLAAIGLPLLARSISEFHQSFGNHELEIAGIIFTDADPQHVKPEHLAGRRDVKQLSKANKWYVFKNEVRHSDSFARGARMGQPLFFTDYARHWVKSEFQLVGKEFMDRIA